MHEFFVALAPYVTHEYFLATVSGVVAPFLHWLLRELGLELSPRKQFWFNVLLSATPFLAMATVWGANGIPEPSGLYISLLATVGASQTIYKTLVKKLMDGRAADVEIPSQA